MMALTIFVFLMVYSVVSLVVIDEIQPEPYMDEVFHIPQTQKYCDGIFDEVIFTLENH